MTSYNGHHRHNVGYRERENGWKILRTKLQRNADCKRLQSVQGITNSHLKVFHCSLENIYKKKKIIRSYFKTTDELADVFKSFSEVRML